MVLRYWILYQVSQMQQPSLQIHVDVNSIPPWQIIEILAAGVVFEISREARVTKGQKISDLPSPINIGIDCNISNAANVRILGP